MSQKYIWIHWECLSVELSVLMASAQWRLDFLQVSYVTDLFPSNARSLFLNESRECWSSRNAGYLPDLHGSANTSQAVCKRYDSKCPSTAAAATGRTDYIRLNVTTETDVNLCVRKMQTCKSVSCLSMGNIFAPEQKPEDPWNEVSFWTQLFSYDISLQVSQIDRNK